MTAPAVFSVKGQTGTANYFIASAEDGRVILFMESDPGYVVGGVAEPLFVTPQSALVNAASFDQHALSPGAIFSIFGRNLPQSSSTQVLVNGEAAPVLFSNSSQINAQMPYDAPTDRPVTLSISSSETSSNAVLLNIQQAAPGIFTYSGNHAVAQNPDNSLNSPSSPAMSATS